MIDVLNLGCGMKRIEKEGWRVVNNDRMEDPKRPWIDVVWDLDTIPWPWEDNSFDRVVALSVFEHLRITLFEALDECWRVLRPGGVLRLKVPHHAADMAYRDASHIWRGWSVHVLDDFDPDTRLGRELAYYGHKQWKILQPARLNRARSSFAAELQVRK